MKIIKDIPTIYYEALKQRIFEDDKDRSGFDYSATELNQPPKRFFLTKRHYDEIEVLASDLLYRLLGSALHAILERVELPNLMKERRFYAKVEGKIISGKPDIYLAERIVNKAIHTIQDAKVTSIWSTIYKDYEDWERQLNIYAYLMTREGYPVDKLSVIPFYRDWRESESKRQKGYPLVRAEEIELPLWGMEDIEGYIIGRVRLMELYKDVLDDDIPECGSKERWEKLSDYAVIKGKKSRATRVFDTRKKAEIYIEEHPRDKGKVPYRIEFRRGEQKLCKVCLAKEFCGWYQRWLKEEG